MFFFPSACLLNCFQLSRAIICYIIHSWDQKCTNEDRFQFNRSCTGPVPGIFRTPLIFLSMLQSVFCSPDTWYRFVVVGEVLLLGYLFHYLPYFFVERTLFLHHYLPAFTFKVLLMAALIEHLHNLFR
jgi:hypothetical protein